MKPTMKEMANGLRELAEVAAALHPEAEQYETRLSLFVDTKHALVVCAKVLGCDKINSSHGYYTVAKDFDGGVTLRVNLSKTPPKPTPLDDEEIPLALFARGVEQDAQDVEAAARAHAQQAHAEAVCDHFENADSTHYETCKLRARRIAQRITQGELAVRAGVSINTIHRCDRWGFIPSAETAQRIADALGCHVSEIFNSEDEPMHEPPELTVTEKLQARKDAKDERDVERFDEQRQGPPFN